MANSYFAFKRFTIFQDQCAMKVCTDSSLFGAWVASLMRDISPSHILDIGTGTGILSMMLAQATTAKIDAIDADYDAAKQAADNFARSPFSGQITVMHTRLQNFRPVTAYDLIICNPPFYEKQLQSPDAKRNAAMHAADLSLKEVANFISKNLTSSGNAAVLLSFPSSDNIEIFSAERLYANRVMQVAQNEDSRFFRSMVIFSRNRYDVINEATMHIRTSENKYSNEFIGLLSDYYLRL